MTPPAIRISVAIPAFNPGRYIEETLASVFGQSYPAHEIVVVDDGSTDNTPALLKAYGDRVRYYREDHRGIGSTRNRCLELVEGEAVAFLDADDLWPSKSLESRAEVLQQDPYLDGVAGMVEQFPSPDLPEEVKKNIRVPEGRTVARLAGSMLLRRRVFHRVGTFDASLRVGETIDWIARADLAGIRISRLQELVLRRRIHENNTVIREKETQSDYLRLLKASLDRRRAAVQEPE